MSLHLPSYSRYKVVGTLTLTFKSRTQKVKKSLLVKRNDNEILYSLLACLENINSALTISCLLLLKRSSTLISLLNMKLIPNTIIIYYLDWTRMQRNVLKRCEQVKSARSGMQIFSMLNIYCINATSTILLLFSIAITQFLYLLWLIQALTPAEESLSKIDGMFYHFIRDQKYYRTRENRNMATVDSTKKRVFWFSVLESAAMIFMACFQVFEWVMLGLCYSDVLFKKCQD